MYVYIYIYTAAILDRANQGGNTTSLGLSTRAYGSTGWGSRMRRTTRTWTTRSPVMQLSFLTLAVQLMDLHVFERAGPVRLVGGPPTSASSDGGGPGARKHRAEGNISPGPPTAACCYTRRPGRGERRRREGGYEFHLLFSAFITRCCGSKALEFMAQPKYRPPLT